MFGEARRGAAIRVALVVAAVTLLALIWPVGSALYAEVYPGPDAGSVKEAITDAGLDARFDAQPVTQYETTTFRAKVIFGTSSPDLPTVKIAWSNEAQLAAQAEGTFEIVPTSASRQFLDASARRPNGGYELTWTWAVTPLVAGKQTLTVSILPTVVVEGKVIPDLLNINRPVPVTVDVHPVQHDVDEVLTAAAAMKTVVPNEMEVGKAYDVSASMSLLGHAATVSADIELAAAKDSSEVTIVAASGAPVAALIVLVASGEADVTRHWTVTSDKAGPVALVFTAKIKGQAAAHPLERTVEKTASARAVEPGPSFWDILQQPVLYVTPFVGLAAAVLGLWVAWKKRKSRAADADEHAAET